MTENITKLEIHRENGKIWSHIRQKWLFETPEERVRQEYLLILVNEYGYRLEQIAEEGSVIGRGAAQARADFIIWRTLEERREQMSPHIIVECKADNVTISMDDYEQGDHYARMSGARFFVTHNNRETKYWRPLHDRMPKTFDELENIPHAAASDKEIEQLLSRLKVFREDEFADLLHQCHNVIRNREKLDPAAAFDEIAKILFIKTGVERRLRSGRTSQNLFTAKFLRDQKVVYATPVENLFDETKREYEADHIFEPNETVNLRDNTVVEIVRLLLNFVWVKEHTAFQAY